MKYHVVYWDDCDKRWYYWVKGTTINEAHAAKHNGTQIYSTLVWLVVEADTDLSKLFNPLIK